MTGLLTNCYKATAQQYRKAAFQFNTAQPEINSHGSYILQDELVEKVKETRKQNGLSILQIAIRGGRHSYLCKYSKQGDHN